MKIDLNKEELEFIKRFFKRSIQRAALRGENIEKATKLCTKLERAYEIGCITENESVTK